MEAHSVMIVVASRGNPFDSSSARRENRACWRTSRHNTIQENDMLTIKQAELPATKCPVKRGKAIINRAKQHGIELPLIITPLSCGGVRVRGARK